MTSVRKLDPKALLSFLEETGLSFRANQRSYVFSSCPRCGKKNKLMMFRNDGRFICWVCAEDSGFKGRAEYALTELTGIPIARIRERIYGDSSEDVSVDYFNVSLWDFYVDEAPPEELVKEVKGLQWPLDFFPIDHKFSAKGREYLQGRGVPLEVAIHYGLRYSPPQSRVIFPITFSGKLVGWQGRFIYPTEVVDETTGETRNIPKALTTGPKNQTLMFADNLAGQDHVIVCEGPIDAIKCHLAGGAVATLGKVIGPHQLDIIKGAKVKKIYLALDLDAGDETAAALKTFNDYFDIDTQERYEVYQLDPAPGYEDLGAMPLELVKSQFDKAERMSVEFLRLGF